MTGAAMIAALIAAASGYWGLRLGLRGQGRRALSIAGAGCFVTLFLIFAGSDPATAERKAMFLVLGLVPAVIGLASGATIGLIWRRKGPDA